MRGQMRGRKSEERWCGGMFRASAQYALFVDVTWICLSEYRTSHDLE